MQAIIFIGIQATGKTTFYVQRLLNTHVRISLDLLRTRHREAQFLDTCLQTQQRFVIDNTNPTKEDRRRYIAMASDAGYEVVGYYFQSLPKASSAPTASSNYQVTQRGLTSCTM
jgi:predicted kinase